MAEVEQVINVEITSTFTYRNELVTRFDCRSCGKAALVYTEYVGTVGQSDELRRTFCEAAVVVAACRYIPVE